MQSEMGRTLSFPPSQIDETEFRDPYLDVHYFYV